MTTIDIKDAAKRLAALVTKAAAGEDVILTRDGQPLARLTRLAGSRRPVRFGRLKGRAKVARDFDAPLALSPHAADDQAFIDAVSEE